MLRRIFNVTRTVLGTPVNIVEKKMKKIDDKRSTAVYKDFLKEVRRDQAGRLQKAKVPDHIIAKYRNSPLLKHMQYVYGESLTNQTMALRNIAKEKPEIAKKALPEIEGLFNYKNKNYKDRENQLVRLEAHLTARKLGGRVKIGQIESFLDSKSEDVVARTINGLIELQAKSSKAKIMQLTNHPSPLVQAWIKEAQTRL